MSRDVFPDYPDEARLWAYVADRPLTANEQTMLQEKLDRFFASWQSHGRPVKGQAQLVDERLLLVGAFVPGGDISGCGIDASVNVLEEVGSDLDIAWLSPLHVFYRSASGEIEAASRSEFRQLAEEGRVTTDTRVFDVSVDTVGQLHRGELEQPAGDSWHGRVFSLAQPAS